MQCPRCGFAIDEVNESQPVCPLCGTDPYGQAESTLDLERLFTGVLVMKIMETMSRSKPAMTPGNDLVN